MWIVSVRARSLITQAAELLSAHDGDALRANAELRRLHPDLDGDRIAALIDQASLAVLASARHGIDPTGLLLTRDGLEQATRPAVSAQRAALLVQQGARHVLDLTAGLGFDTRAFLAAGLQVVAVERNPATAAMLRVNAPGAEVIEGDALAVAPALIADLAPHDVVFIDPARRSGRRTADGARAHPERDPERWSPPWSFVTSLSEGGARVCAKVAPGFAPASLPPGWCGVWTSVDRTMVEAMTCSWDIGAQRTARSIADVTVDFASSDLLPGPTSPVSAWLIEPDASLVSAHLLDAWCSTHAGVHRIDPTGPWLTSATEVTDPLVRAFAVIDQLPNDAKGLRRALIAHGIGDLTVKCRGMGIDAEALRRQLRLPPGRPGTLVIARAQGRRTSLLVHDHR
ncbi:MAG: hypothetical protein PHU75_00035 [Candidatus Nanopelagicales bacterium]|nr:hypothetical protein [Candidatus Nanopelagicales bacterium]